MASLADLPDLAARLSAELSAASIPHAVSGALAMAAYGYVSATRHIDILVAAPAAPRSLTGDGSERSCATMLRE